MNQDIILKLIPIVNFCQVPANEIFLNFDRPSKFVYIFIRGKIK